MQVEWKSLQSQIETLLKGRVYEKPSEAFADRSKVLAEARVLMENAGDRSKLSEESVGERYRLMIALQYKGPELLDALANSQAIGAGLTARKVIEGITPTEGKSDVVSLVREVRKILENETAASRAR